MKKMKGSFLKRLSVALMLSLLSTLIPQGMMSAYAEAAVSIYTYGDENGAKDESEIFDGVNMVDWTLSKIEGDESNPMFEAYAQDMDGETVWTLKRQRDSKNKNNANGYITYKVKDITAFSASFIIGMNQGYMPPEASFFISSDGDNFTEHNVIVKNGVNPEADGDFKRWTYTGYDLPQDTEYLQIHFPGLPDASDAGFKTVQLENVIVNTDSSLGEWESGAKAEIESVSDTAVKVKWPAFDSDEDFSYVLSKDGEYVNTVNKNTTSYSVPVEEHTEYRFQVAAVAEKDGGISLISPLLSSDIVKTSGNAAIFVDKFKFAETIENGKTWNGGTPAWNKSTKSVQRTNQNDNLEVVYEIAEGIKGFEVTILAYNPKALPGETLFYVKGDDFDWQAVQTTKVDELGSPNWRTVPWVYTATDIPEGANKLKIVFGAASTGNNRQNTVQLNKVVITKAEVGETAAGSVVEEYDENTGTGFGKYMEAYTNAGAVNNINNSGNWAILRKTAAEGMSFVYSTASINAALGEVYSSMSAYSFKFAVNKSSGKIGEVTLSYLKEAESEYTTITDAVARVTDTIYDATGLLAQYEVYELSGNLPENVKKIKIDIAPAQKPKIYSVCYGGGEIFMNKKPTGDYYTFAGELSAECTDTAITVNWPNVAGNPSDIKYVIESDAENVEVTDSSKRSYTFYGLTPGEEYEFTVRAVNVSDGSKKSQKLTATFMTYANEDLWNGEKGQYEQDNTDITLTIPAISGFDSVEYTIFDIDGNKVAAVSDSNTYVFKNLEQGSHTFSIQAVAKSGDDVHYSTRLYVTIIAGEVEKWPVGAKISVFDINKDSFSLRWPAFENMEGRVYSILLSGEKTGETQSTEYKVTKLEPGKTYGISVVVTENGKIVSEAITAQAETAMERDFYIDFMGSDLSNEDWTKNTYYRSAEEIPHLVELNDAAFSVAQHANDPEGPVWGAFFRNSHKNSPESFIAVDLGAPVSEFYVTTLVTGAESAIKIEYAEDDGEEQLTLGNFDSSDYEWTSLVGSYSAVQIGTKGEWDASKNVRKTDRQVYEHRISKLPPNARYFRIFFSNITSMTNNEYRAWRSGTLGFGGTYSDEVQDALNTFDFSTVIAAGDSVNGITKNLTLPDNIGGFPVEWESSIPEVITNDGVIKSENIKKGYTLSDIVLTAYIKKSALDASYAAERSWTVTVIKDTSGWSDEEYINFDLQIFENSDAITKPQAAVAVYSDIALPKSIEGGSNISWSVSDSTYAEISNGVLKVKPAKDQEVTFNLILTAERGGQSKSREYPITLVRTYGDNIAWGSASVSASSNKQSAANAATKDSNTYWESASDDADKYLEYKFKNAVDFTAVLVAAKTDDIESFIISASEDGKVFDSIYTGGALKAFEKTLIPIDASGVKNVRIAFKVKDGAKAVITNFEIYNEPVTDEQIFEAVFKAIDIPKRATGDIDLPETGYNNIPIKWSSSDSGAITDKGEVTMKSSAVEVILTATVTHNGVTKTKQFTVAVPKKTSGGSSSGGFGGGGGGGSSAGGVYIPPAAAQEAEKPAAEASIYKDVPTNHWAYKYIKSLSDRGIVSGMGNGEFAPGATVTREAFLRMLLEGAGIEVSDGATVFADVVENSWYAPYVAKAYELGIVSGISDDNFGIGLGIRRQDMAVMVYRLLKAKEIKADLKEAVYADSADISEYAKEAVAALDALSVMNGNDENRFMPSNNATRAEASRIVYDVAGLIK